VRRSVARDVDGARVRAALGSLQPDLDEVKGVADDDGADAAEAAGDEGAQLRGGGGFCFFADGRVCGRWW